MKHNYLLKFFTIGRQFLFRLSMMACLVLVAANAFAISGSSFTKDRLIYDLKWNATYGYLEFKVMFHDTYGNNRDEWIKSAELYINNMKLATLSVYADAIKNKDIVPENDRRANLRVVPEASNSKWINGYMFVYSYGIAPYADALNTSTTLQEIQVDPTATKSYTFGVGGVSGNNHAYATFRYYPVEMDSDYNYSFELKNITLEEQTTGSTKDITFEVKNYQLASMPAAPTMSISGGEIVNDGELTFTCNAQGASKIELLKNGTKVDEKASSNATFTGKYFTGDDGWGNYYQGNVPFSFDVYVSAQGGRTIYRYPSGNIYSQLTGVFTYSGVANKGITISPDSCGQITLKWIIQNPSVTSNVNTSGFDLQMQKGTETGWTTISSGVPDYKASTTSTTTYSYAYQIPDSELGKGEVPYKFRIKRKFADWDDKTLMHSNGTYYFQAQGDATVNTDFKQLSGITIAQGTGGYPKLNWSMTTSGFGCNKSAKLTLKVDGREANITDYLAAGGFQTASAHGVVQCQKQRYELVLQYGTMTTYTYTVSENYVMDNVQTPGFAENQPIAASKGYYADYINVKWYPEANNDSFEKFRLWRKEMDNTGAERILLTEISHTPGLSQYSYNDNNVNAGIYYTYIVEGLYACENVTGSIETSEEIGFSQPYGSVSGRITYEGSQAVEGVQVNLITEDKLRSNRELEFSQGRSNSYIQLPHHTKLFSREGFTFQAWIKPSYDTNLMYMVDNDIIAIARAGTNEYLRIIRKEAGGTYSSTVSAAPNGVYTHITVAVERDAGDTEYKNYILHIYLNGELSETLTFERTIPAPEVTSLSRIGGTAGANNNGYSGVMDDIRIWDKALTAEEIANNYDRVLGGKEDNLQAYYRCDETDVIDGWLYDCSAVGNAFNGRHAEKKDGVLRQDVPIDATHLTLKGITNKNGIYQITNAIPYTSQGTLYEVVPMLGVHSFNPTSRPLYFTSKSSEFNNVDFTDVSSFTISGKVLYEGGTYPVEGAQFKVDGQVLVTNDGMPVTSNADGTFEIQVPIGEHEVKVEKSGHTFKDGGRLLEQGKNINYNSNLSDLRFWDQTRVKLIGHIVGGQRENKKTSGFGFRKNNIGAETFTLTAKKNYLLAGEGVNKLRTDATFYHTTVNEQIVSDTTHLTVLGNDLIITVSPVTGEYVAWVYPEEYSIGNITVKNKNGDNLLIYDKNETLDLRDATVIDERVLQTSVRTWTDSVWVEPVGNKQGYYEKFEQTDTVKFHKEWGYFYQAIPNYTLTQMVDNKKTEYFGDSLLTIKTAGEEINVALIDEEGKYIFGKPVFRQGERYIYFLKAFEEYYNANAEYDGIKGVTDIMAVSGATALITTSLALVEEEVSVPLDDNGEATYEFIAGAPNLIDGVKNLSSTVYIDGYTYSPTNLPEQNGSNMSAYLLGSKSTGTDFMTAASDQIDFILHDPPGSASYAFIEKGSTLTKSMSYNLADGLTSELELNTLLGTDNFILAGVGLLSGGESSVVHKVGLHEQLEHRMIDNDTYIETTTLTDNLSTSSSEDYVGHGGDIFVGTGTNILYGWSNTLSVRKEGDFDPADVLISGEEYSIVRSKSMAFGTTLSTRFFFTELEIEYIQIPKWREAIENLFLFSAPDVVTEPVYVSKLQKSDKNFGKPNSDPVFGAESTKLTRNENALEGPSYTVYYPEGYLEKFLDGMDKNKDIEHGTVNMTDTIAYLHQKIADWEALLERNEKNKVETEVSGNISFGGGVSITKSETLISEHQSETGWTLSSNLTFQGETGFNILGMGLEVKANAGWGHDEENIEGETVTEESTIGFVLEENGTNDELTVDYGRDPEFNTFVFRTRGGRTSCPYEGEVKTRYYEPGNHILSEATMQIEKPVIDVASGIYRTQVPATRPAIFDLKLMNESETGNSGIFRLLVDESTNPDGAILKIDGATIGNGRDVMIPGDQAILKTLTIEKGPNVDSCKVRIILASACQFDQIGLGADLFDDIELTAYFIPACTEAEIVSPANNWAVNTNTGSTMMIEIGNYDLNYANFGHIELQYRRAGASAWSTIMTFFGDEARYNLSPINTSNKQLIDNLKSSIQYEWDMTNLPEGDASYEIRVRSVCETSNLAFISEYYSDALSGVKDMVRPESLGAPSPVNGIFAAGDEISITFNEEIQTGRLTDNNFRISGILNAEQIAEPNIGVWFNGSTSAFTELPIFNNGSFSIETWFKRTPGAAGTLFAYGEGNNYISLGFDTEGYAIVNIGGVQSKSDKAINNADQTWKYIGLAYDRAANAVSVYGFQGSENLELFRAKSLTGEPSTQGRLYVGNNAAGNSGFNGAVGLFHFYDIARTQAEMAAGMNVTKSGSETNLIGLWEMNEGEGDTATDKARARHLTLNTGWYVYPAGKSLLFNGVEQYASVPSGTFPFHSYDDFTVEFWFKGAAQSEANLLSIGTKVHIGFSANRILTLTCGADTQILSSADLLDNEWHHFALSVKRNGMATAIVDGAAAASFSSSILAGDVGGGFYTLGAQYNYDGRQEAYTQYFNGNIDELRVWNMALSTNPVKLYKKHKLTGDEFGLKAYYPFESWFKQDNGIYTVTEEIRNLANISDELDKYGSISDEAAAMYDARPEKTLGYGTDYTYTASSNKIVFNILTDLYRIEGVTLTIAAEGILDLRDNISKPAQWIAYVNRNPLNWLTDKVEIAMTQDETKSFKAMISNAGGTSADYYIGNLPSWLSVDAPSGTLQPLQTKELTFTVSKVINTGSYEASITLEGTNNVRKILPVALKLTGDLPLWSVTPSGFEHSMNITGRVHIQGVPQEDADDLLAAFIGDLCVGVVNPSYVKSHNSYYVFMDVYGNDEHQNQSVQFKLWDASTGKIYPRVSVSAGEINFVAGDIRGSLSSPVIFDAANYSEQSIDLKQGWTWISSNLLNDSPSILEQVKTSLGSRGVIVKSRTQYIQNPSWIGNLALISAESMYLINASESHTLLLEGVPAVASGTPIALSQGWNWIGYIPQFNLPVKDALASISAQDGDLIKAQSGYAVYASGNWIGSLSTMQPGKGYMYYSASGNQSLTYPSQAVTTRSASMPPSLRWTADEGKYPNTMSVTGIAILNGKTLESSEIEIGAFSGNECRGSIRLQQMPTIEGEPYLAFLTVYGEAGDEIMFRIYDHETGNLYESENSPLVFTADNILGTPFNPYQIIISQSIDIDDVSLSDLTVDAGTLSPSFSPDVLNYTVEVGYSIEQIIITATAANPAATIEGAGRKTLEPGVNTFTIVVISADGVSSEVYTVRVVRADNITMEGDLSGDGFDIKLYPNPTDGKAFIEFSGAAGQVDLSIYNFGGMKIFAGSYPAGERIELDMSGVPSGTYLVEIRTGAKREVKKLIVR